MKKEEIKKAALECGVDSHAFYTWNWKRCKTPGECFNAIDTQLQYDAFRDWNFDYIVEQRKAFSDFQHWYATNVLSKALQEEQF
jgi:hypothetical protein